MGEQVAARIKKEEDVRQNRCRCIKLHIDTGKDELQLITANPISRAVLLMIAGFTSD